MLKSFALHDGNLDNKKVGKLTFDTESREFRMFLEKSVPLDRLPLSLRIFAHRDIYSLNNEHVLKWIQGRIAPPSRHNIKAIMKELEIKEYDEFALLCDTMGRCGKTSCIWLKC